MSWFYELHPDAIRNLPQVGVDSLEEQNLPQVEVKTGCGIFNIPWGHNKLIIDKCKGDPSKANFFVKAQYAVNMFNAPIGISEYELSNVMPEEFKSSMPTIEEIENELKRHGFQRDGVRGGFGTEPPTPFLTEDKVQRSIDKLDCEVIQIDGTRSVSDNLSIIMKIVMG